MPDCQTIGKFLYLVSFNWGFLPPCGRERGAEEVAEYFIKVVLFCHLEKEMATHFGTLAWKIPWTEEPGRLQSIGSQRVGHNWATSLHFFTSAIILHSPFNMNIYHWLNAFSVLMCYIYIYIYIYIHAYIHTYIHKYI